MSSTDDHQLPLLPADPSRWGGPAPVTTTPIRTQGRTEYAVSCDGCGGVHRHVSPGVRTAPCGATYTVPEDQEHDHGEEHSPP